MVGDGEKCKRVNLRCGEKVFKRRSQEINRNIEGHGKKGKRRRVKGGEWGKRVLKHLHRVSARDWNSG